MSEAEPLETAAGAFMDRVEAEEAAVAPELPPAPEAPPVELSLGLSMTVCNSCWRNIINGRDFVTWCMDCDNFCLCDECASKGGHPEDHVLYREPHLELSNADRLKADECSCVGQMLRNAMETYSSRPMLGMRERIDLNPHTVDEQPGAGLGRYRWATYGEVLAATQRFRGALHHIGVRPGDMVAICGANSPEWYVADFAASISHCVIAPVHITMGPAELTPVFNRLRVVAVVCSQEVSAAVLEACEGADCVQSVVVIAGANASGLFPASCFPPTPPPNPTPVLQTQGQGGRVRVYDFAELLRTSPDLPEEVERQMEAEAPQPTDVSSVYLTSGSTGGDAKGVARPHSRRMQRMSRYKHRRDICLNFAPLAHSERDNNLLSFAGGGAIGLQSGDLSTLFSDLWTLRVTDISAVPRVYNIIHEHYLHSVAVAKSISESVRDRNADHVDEAEMKTLLATLPDPAHSPTKVRALSMAIVSHSTARIEKAVRGAWRLLLGDRCRMLHTGGAAISQEVLRFLKATFAAHVSDGIAATECGTIAIDGHIPSTRDVRLRDCEGYTTDDKPYPRGEILVKGDDIATGYFNDPEATAERFTPEGYFCTGDIGERLSDGRLRIVGRVKNTTKLAQGEWVNLDKLDTLFGELSLVGQVFCHGQSDKPSVVAVVVGSELLRETATDEAPAEALVLKAMRLLGRRKGVREFEIPRAVHVVWEPFTVENGLLTPSVKPCRPKLKQRYAEVLALMLDTPTATSTPTVAAAVSAMLARVSDLSEDEDEDSDAAEQGMMQGGLDSLSAVRLYSMIQDEFNVTIPMHMLVGADASVEGVANLISRSRDRVVDLSAENADDDAVAYDARQKGGQLSKSVPFSVEDETALPPRCTSEVIEALPDQGGLERGDVLLTGATGFVGVSLLWELLTVTDRRVLCVVRGDSSEAAAQRLFGAVEAAMQAELTAEQRARVVVHAGDLSQPLLGLAEEAFEEVARSVAVVIHNGALVNVVLDYAAHQPANVEGTRTVIDLCCRGRRKRLLYVSTLSVFDQASPEHAPLTPEVQQLHRLGGYGQSKWVAEKLVVGARRQGLEAFVCRLGTVCGSSTTGYQNPSDFVGRFLLGLAQMGTYPTVPAAVARLQMTPADFVAKSLVFLALRPLDERSSSNYHVLARNTIVPLSRIVEGIRAAGVRMVPLSLPEWVQQLRASRACALNGLSHYFGDDKFPGSRESWSRTSFAGVMAQSPSRSSQSSPSGSPAPAPSSAEEAVESPVVSAEVVMRYVQRLLQQ